MILVAVLAATAALVATPTQSFAFACPPLSTLCGPGGLQTLATAEGLTIAAEVPVVAAAPVTQAASGFSLSTLGASTAGGLLGLTGWLAGDAVFGDEGADHLTGAGVAVDRRGWTPSNVLNDDPSWSLRLEIVSVTGASYTGPSTFTVTGNYQASAGARLGFGLLRACRSASGGTLPSAYFRNVPTIYFTGSGTFSFTSTCEGGLAWIKAPTSYGSTGTSISYYPPGSPNRTAPNPIVSEVATGTYIRTVQCQDSTGKIQSVSHGAILDASPGAVFPLPEVACPTGTSPVGFSSRWVPADGSASQVITPSTPYPDWALNIRRDFPDCAGGQCIVELFRSTSGTDVSCGYAATSCPDWYISPTRATDYTCRWGPYEVELHYCSIFRDPGFLLPNSFPGADGGSVYRAWPPLDLTTAVAQRAAGRIVARYGEGACAAVGEAVRSALAQVSIPDMVLVCRAQGLATGMDFALRSWPASGPGPLVDALVETADGDPITVLEPECNHLSSDGRCLDDEGIESEPEAQPDPAGSGVRPPPNCLDDTARQQLINSMRWEDHHMATHFGVWGERFQRIFDAYGLNGKTGAWNLHNMKHAGPHPWNYHNWVMQRVQAAHEYAQTFPTLEEQREAFLDEFEREIVDVVLQDPTVVRAAYWKCRDDYRWR